MNLMSLLGESDKLDKDDRQYATLAAKELGRVVHLIRQSLSFYREAASTTTEVNLEEVLESILELYAKQIESKQITVTKQYFLNGAIHGFPAEIRQVFSTLLVNAMEAVPHGGRIMVRASSSVDWRNLAVQGGRIMVADNGNGIPSHLVGRVFEPFFTTKGEQGTGLGLWVTHGIVSRMGGSIRVRSCIEQNKSTCFSVFFPNQAPRRM